MTVAVVGVLTTGAYAYGGNNNCDGSGQKGMKNQQGMQQQTEKRGWHGYKMRQKGIQHSDNMMMGRHGGMRMLSQLNLSDDQQFKISILRDEMRLDMKKLRGAKRQSRMLKFIGDNGFDKKAFIKEADTNHAKMIDIKADHMEKVFKILTKEQIAELKKKINS